MSKHKAHISAGPLFMSNPLLLDKELKPTGRKTRFLQQTYEYLDKIFNLQKRCPQWVSN